MAFYHTALRCAYRQSRRSNIRATRECRTPAMAAGVTDRLWSVGDLLERSQRRLELSESAVGDAMSWHCSVLGLAHIGIRVHDLTRSRKFYELLGFKLAWGPFGPEQVAAMTHPSGLEINLIVNAPEPKSQNVLMDVPEKHAGFTHIALKIRCSVSRWAATSRWWRTESRSSASVRSPARKPRCWRSNARLPKRSQILVSKGERANLPIRSRRILVSIMRSRLSNDW